MVIVVERQWLACEGGVLRDLGWSLGFWNQQWRDTLKTDYGKSLIRNFTYKWYNQTKESLYSITFEYMDSIEIVFLQTKLCLVVYAWKHCKHAFLLCWSVSIFYLAFWIQHIWRVLTGLGEVAFSLTPLGPFSHLIIVLSNFLLISAIW